MTAGSTGPRSPFLVPRVDCDPRRRARIRCSSAIGQRDATRFESQEAAESSCVPVATLSVGSRQELVHLGQELGEVEVAVAGVTGGLEVGIVPVALFLGQSGVLLPGRMVLCA